MNTRIESFRCIASCAFLCLTVLLIPACHRTKTPPPAAKRYPFTGRVISIDAKSGSALIDGDLVQGFMEPMAMSYKIKPASTLRDLAPGDSISAEVVVIEPDPNNREAEPDYWLEKVKVTEHAKNPPARGPTSFHMLQPGEDVRRRGETGRRKSRAIYARRRSAPTAGLRSGIEAASGRFLI